MAGTRAGGKKSARKIGKKALAERGRKGGQSVAPDKRTFSTDRSLASKAGRAGGKAKAIKYQNPNFDKEEYRRRRNTVVPVTKTITGPGGVPKTITGERRLSGTERPRTVGTTLSPDEYLRRTNIKEYNRQKGIEVDDEADQSISE